MTRGTYAVKSPSMPPNPLHGATPPHRTRRLDETCQALGRVTSDHRTALLHNDQLRAQADELFKALEAAEGASR